jgi:hypothetical protein
MAVSVRLYLRIYDIICLWYVGLRGAGGGGRAGLSMELVTEDL